MIMAKERKPSATRLKSWASRAHTLQIKASDLFTDMEAWLGDNETRLMPLVGDTMCSAAELRHTLEGQAERAAQKKSTLPSPSTGEMVRGNG
jgi:hypothetical protein